MTAAERPVKAEKIKAPLITITKRDSLPLYRRILIRAAAIVAALPESERASLPPVVDITCHMCGRTCSVSRGDVEAGT